MEYMIHHLSLETFAVDSAAKRHCQTQKATDNHSRICNPTKYTHHGQADVGDVLPPDDESI